MGRGREAKVAVREFDKTGFQPVLSIGRQECLPHHLFGITQVGPLDPTIVPHGSLTLAVLKTSAG
jgi:hypothetical protein